MQGNYYQRIAKQLREGQQALELSDYASGDEKKGRASNAEVVMSDDEAVEKILAKVRASDELRARDPQSTKGLLSPKNWQECLTRMRNRYDLRERLSGMIEDTLALGARNTELGNPKSDEEIHEVQRGTLHYLDSLIARHEALDRLEGLLKRSDK